MNIRLSTNADIPEIHKLHIESIQFYCAAFYSQSQINAWINLKKLEEYSCEQKNRVIIVAQEENEIVGFGMLNTEKHTIEGLYIKPNRSRNGIGSDLMKKIEKIAHERKMDTLSLYSTLNAVNFYRSMGYGNETKSIFKLSSGEELNCVFMMKNLRV